VWGAWSCHGAKSSEYEYAGGVAWRSDGVLVLMCAILRRSMTWWLLASLRRSAGKKRLSRCRPLPATAPTCDNLVWQSRARSYHPAPPRTQLSPTPARRAVEIRELSKSWPSQQCCLYLASVLLLAAGGAGAGEGSRPPILYKGIQKFPLDHPPLLIRWVTPGEQNDDGELTSLVLRVQQVAPGVHYVVDVELTRDIVVEDGIDHAILWHCRAESVLGQTEAVMVVPCAGPVPGKYEVRVNIYDLHPDLAEEDTLLATWRKQMVVEAPQWSLDEGMHAQHVDLLAPQQGFLSRDGTLRIEWQAKGVSADGGALHIVLMVNGLVALVTNAPGIGAGRVAGGGGHVLGALSDRQYFAHVFLGQYEEFDGMVTQVASAWGIVDGHASGGGSIMLGALSDGPYRVHVFLGQYDDLAGIRNVQSSALVECRVDATGVLGGVSPTNPEVGMVPGFTAYVPATLTGAQPGRGPVVVFTYHCNRPDFVKMQADALRHFMLDDFKLLVINDAQSDEMRTAISEASRSVGAESIITPDYLDHSDPSQVVGHIVTWSMQEVALQRFNDSVVMLLEGDMFPVAPFSPLDFLSGYHIAGTPQGRRHASSGFLLRYVWVGLLLVDLKDLPNKHLLNMNVAVVGDVNGDTASAMHHFFDASPQVKVRRILHTSHVHQENGNLYVLPPLAQEKYHNAFRIELYERAFLHYGSASNWKIGRNLEYFNSGEDFMPAKTRFVEWFVSSAIKGHLKIEPYDYVFEVWNWLDDPTGPAVPTAGTPHPEHRGGGVGPTG
jgi:hypothetical protein